jgi:hypothetical protein
VLWQISGLSGSVRRALAHAGLGPAFKGAHLLRHYAPFRTMSSDQPI